MIDQATFLLQQYPILQHIVAVMVIGRVVFKPLMLIIAKYVELTVDEEDDKKLHKIMKTKSYRLLAFTVDLLSSAKLPTLKKK